MRKLISAGMALVMMVTLAACGQSGSGAASTEAQSSSAVETEAESGEAAEEITGETPADTAEETDGAGAEHNILVAYFSWSGNTQEMASYIAEQTGGDLLEIQLTTPTRRTTTSAATWRWKSGTITSVRPSPIFRNSLISMMPF